MKKYVLLQHCGSVGGSGLGLLTTAQILRDLGNEVVIYCETQPDEMYRRYDQEGFKTKPFPVPLLMNQYFNGGAELFTVSNLAVFWQYKNCVATWKKVIEDENADFFIVNSLVLSWMYRVVSGTKCKIICHVREVLRSTKNFCGKMILDELNHFDEVWYISEHEKNKQALTHPKTFMVRDCLLKDSYIPSDIEISHSKRDKFTTVYVGGVVQIKGFPTLVEACRYLPDNIEVLIAGYKNEPKLVNSKMNWFYRHRIRDFHIMKRAYELSLKDSHIRYLGHQSSMDSLFRDCDAVVFPSKLPHQARPAFEGGIWGKPVIISDFAETRDAVRNMENGITFRPNDPKALAEAIIMLANDADLCISLGNNNRKYAFQHHLYQCVYEEIRTAMESMK